MLTANAWLIMESSWQMVARFFPQVLQTRKKSVIKSPYRRLAER